MEKIKKKIKMMMENGSSCHAIITSLMKYWRLAEIKHFITCLFLLAMVCHLSSLMYFMTLFYKKKVDCISVKRDQK